MVRSKNISHTVQLIVGILLAVYLMFNINSLSNLEDISQNVPDISIEMSGKLASIGNQIQTVTEDGFLQSVISTIMGDGVSFTENENTVKDPPIEVVEETSVEQNTGNIGEWIEGVGQWFAGLWFGGEGVMTEVASLKVEDVPLSEEMSLAAEPFAQLSRPYISHVPVRDEQLSEITRHDDETTA